MKYVYPAVFSLENNGQYSIYFPDIKGCYTCGDNLQDGIFMAEDVLAFTIYEEYERKRRPVPVSSTLSSITLKNGEFVNYIACDTILYAKRNSKRSVKKTLTIPEWLDFAANEMNLNFSQVLQEAIKSKLEL